MRVTPFPTEPTRLIIENTADEICMFSSDFPHVEGGRNPLRRFDNEVAALSDETQDRFFRANFEDLMGTAISGLLGATSSYEYKTRQLKIQPRQKCSEAPTPHTRDT